MWWWYARKVAVCFSANKLLHPPTHSKKQTIPPTNYVKDMPVKEKLLVVVEVVVLGPPKPLTLPQEAVEEERGAIWRTPNMGMVLWMEEALRPPPLLLMLLMETVGDLGMNKEMLCWDWCWAEVWG